jgi:hypothetical protein
MGKYSFRWLTQWAGGGYDERRKFQRFDVETESLEEAEIRLVSHLCGMRENCHQLFEVLTPGMNSYQALNIVVGGQGCSALFPFQFTSAKFVLRAP